MISHRNGPPLWIYGTASTMHKMEKILAMTSIILPKPAPVPLLLLQILPLDPVITMFMASVQILCYP